MKMNQKNENEISGQSKLPGIELGIEEERFGVPEEYNEVALKEVELENEDGEMVGEFMGRPVLGPIESFSNKDGEINYSVKLLLLEDESKEGLSIPIGLKGGEEVQSNIHNQSKLYKFLYSLMKTRYPENFEDKSVINNANLEEIRPWINSLKAIRISISEETNTIDNEVITYPVFFVNGIVESNGDIFGDDED